MQRCFASYDDPRSRIHVNDSFNRMWYDFDNISEVESNITQTLIDAGDVPPTAAQVKARKDTLNGFKYNATTAAGIYRGRLSNLYQCVPSPPPLQAEPVASGSSFNEACLLSQQLASWCHRVGH